MLPTIDENEIIRFETFFHKEAMKYVKSKSGCGSTRVLGSYIGDPQAVKLDLLRKIRLFVSQLRQLSILGLVQVQITLLRESYNARFDHLARSIAPEAIAPAALWYDHFINLALASIIRTTVNYEMDEEGVPPTYTTYNDWLQLLRR